MKPDFVSPMTMCKTAWRFASDDLSPAFSANIARPLYRFLSLRRHADIMPFGRPFPHLDDPVRGNNPHRSVRRPAA